jgi:hypothetical protein
MSKEKKVCIFDNDKECPARKASVGAGKLDWDLSDLASKVCPLCPIRAELMKGKGSFGSMD